MHLPVVAFHFRRVSMRIITFSAFVFFVRMLDSSVSVHVFVVRCVVVTIFTFPLEIVLDLVKPFTVCCGQCILNRFLAEKEN